MDNELVAKIKEALSSKKCTARGPFDPGYEFEDLLREYPDIDLTRMYVPLLVEATEIGLKFPGQMEPGLGNKYCIYVPYSKIPDLVEDERIVKIEGNPSGKYPDSA